LHALLAAPSDDEAFQPVAITISEAENWAANTRVQLDAAFDLLAAIKVFSNETEATQAAFVLKSRSKIIAHLAAMANAGIGSLQTRIHGDFHLGQILVVTNDAYIIDFEGEPSKPLALRRAKSSPMRDVAGLLRSFHYAAAAAEISYATSPIASPEIDHVGTLSRFVADVSEQFLIAYRVVASAAMHPWVVDQNSECALLNLFLLEKSAYEICYEAANRPTWLGIPLEGIYEIMKRVLTTIPEAEHA
jgi:maltose alpha-D-glucosyltransferase/alpha-amylase